MWNLPRGKSLDTCVASASSKSTVSCLSMLRHFGGAKTDSLMVNGNCVVNPMGIALLVLTFCIFCLLIKTTFELG